MDYDFGVLNLTFTVLKQKIFSVRGKSTGAVQQLKETAGNNPDCIQYEVNITSKTVSYNEECILAKFSQQKSLGAKENVNKYKKNSTFILQYDETTRLWLGRASSMTMHEGSFN